MLKTGINKKYILIISLLASVAAAVRLYINYSTEFMPGAVGAFYIVQLRSILDTGSLAFKDFPLLFYLEAIFAKAIIFIFQMNIDSAVNHASRIFDSVVPAVSIFPAYMLLGRMLKEKLKENEIILISSASIFYISFFTLVSDYQKNSLGLLWLFFMIYFVYKSFDERKINNYLLAFLFFVLTGFTHFGTFAVAIFFLSIFFTVNYLKSFTVKRFIRFTAEVILVLVLGLGTIFYFSPERVTLLINAPSELFVDPIIISVLKGKQAISDIDLLNISIVNLIAICGLVIFFYKREKIKNFSDAFVLSSTIAGLILSSPFLGIEWGQRLYLISYVFTVPILALIWHVNVEKHRRRFINASAAIILTASILVSLSTQQFSNMDKYKYAELNEIKKIFLKNEHSIIVARLGLHYWSAWAFNSLIAREEDLRRGWWGSGYKIYFLRQTSGIVPFGTAGLYGRQFPEPRIPKNAALLFKGKYYELFWIENPPEYLRK